MPASHARAGALVGVLSLALSFPLTTLSAQNSFQDAVRELNRDDVRGYAQPLADVLVANLSSAFFATASPRRSFGLSVEVAAMGTTVSESMRTYTAKTPAGFQPSSFTAPTVFGGKATPVAHSTIPGLSYRTSDGVLDAKMFPTAVPQIRVSGLANTEVVVRYFDSKLLGSSYPREDLPNLSMYGIGARHALHQYFGDLPFEVAVSASLNSLTFGDYASLSGTTFGVNVGKTLGMLSLLGGAESTGGTMNLSYTSTNAEDPGSVDIDLEAKRRIRFNAGATLDLKVVKLFGTAGFGDITTYAAGLRIGR